MSVFGLALCLMFAWGVGMWSAPLYAWAKDVRYVLRLALPFWMFLTPILYPIEKLHGKSRLLAEINPLSSPIEMIKVGLLGAGSVRIYAAIVEHRRHRAHLPLGRLVHHPVRPWARRHRPRAASPRTTTSSCEEAMSWRTATSWGSPGSAGATACLTA